VQLTDAEKLILIMLSNIQQHLKIEGGVDPKFVQSAINSGNTWALKWEYPGIFGVTETPREVVEEVVDVLEMWSFLESSYERLSDRDKTLVETDAGNVRFRGFDGNNEGDHMSAARFFVDHLERFQEFRGRDLNSHTHSIDRYRRMLKVFKPLRPLLFDGLFAAEHVIAILSASAHPPTIDHSAEVAGKP
jgi:uncharacterized protein YfbU (UPF0304 family)